MDLGLGGSRAIVTGGSRGIGLAIADRLAEEGADVAVCARGEQGLAEALATLEARGGRALAAAVDVRDADAYARFTDDAVRDLGGLDVFVANVSAMAEGAGEAAFRESFEVDLLHVVRGCELAAPRLEAGGSIVIVGSASAVLAGSDPEERAYGSIKAAIVSYAGQLAHALAARGVRVNCVQPGAILVPGGYWEELGASAPDRLAAMEQSHPLGRLGRPEEVAAAVAYLASPLAGFVTGANLRVDGGLLGTINF